MSSLKINLTGWTQTCLSNFKYFSGYFEEEFHNSGHYQSVVPIQDSEILRVFREGGGVDVAEMLDLSRDKNFLTKKGPHFGKEDVFKCKDCVKTFGQKKMLNNHKKEHKLYQLYHPKVGSFKPFRCKYCLKAFWKKENLKNHKLNYCMSTRPCIW